MLAVQAAAPALKAAQGSVVLFSSIAAHVGFAQHGAIGAAKGAIEGLAVLLAAELAPHVRANTIAPSLTDTPIASAASHCQCAGCRRNCVPASDPAAGPGRRRRCARRLFRPRWKPAGSPENPSASLTAAGRHCAQDRPRYDAVRQLAVRITCAHDIYRLVPPGSAPDRQSGSGRCGRARAGSPGLHSG